MVSILRAKIPPAASFSIIRYGKGKLFYWSLRHSRPARCLSRCKIPWGLACSMSGLNLKVSTSSCWSLTDGSVING